MRSMNPLRSFVLIFSLQVMAPSGLPANASNGLCACLPDDGKAKAVASKEDKPKKRAAKQHRGKFTISKETTYVTGPLDKDGYIDYAAALNEQLGKGVTPENNANVLIWKAIGPIHGSKKMPAEFFQLMGIPEPPEKGEYLIELSQYLRKHLKTEDPEELQEIDDQLTRSTQRPWSIQQYPKLASWLKANEKPLVMVVEASRRPQYFSPVVPSKTEKGSY